MEGEEGDLDKTKPRGCGALFYLKVKSFLLAKRAVTCLFSFHNIYILILCFMTMTEPLQRIYEGY